MLLAVVLWWEARRMRARVGAVDAQLRGLEAEVDATPDELRARPGNPLIAAPRRADPAR